MMYDLSHLKDKEVIVRVRQLGALHMRRIKGTVSGTYGHMISLKGSHELTPPSDEDSLNFDDCEEVLFNTAYAYFHSVGVLRTNGRKHKSTKKTRQTPSPKCSAK